MADLIMLLILFGFLAFVLHLKDKLQEIEQLERRVASLEYKLRSLSEELGVQVTHPATANNVSSDVVYLLQRGLKINAIKLYRDQTGATLQEAKDFLDRLEKQL